MSGRQANSSGKLAEGMIATVLEQVGCTVERQVACGTSIYGKTIRADLKVDDQIFIEVKYQDVAGTNDEKLPYLFANIDAGCYPLPVVVILLGGGFYDGAIDWMTSRASPHLDSVLVGDEWSRWAFRLKKG